MTIISNLGFPRIGRRRELKTALEQFWAGSVDEADLLSQAARLRAAHWRLQFGRGIGHVPSGDASLYDHVLDTACMFGAIPAGYGWQDGPVSLPTYFALARGSRGTAQEAEAGIAPGLPALEMTKWFDTNYHYLVPRLSRNQRFVLTENRPLANFREALALAGHALPARLDREEPRRARRNRGDVGLVVEHHERRRAEAGADRFHAFPAHRRVELRRGDERGRVALHDRLQRASVPHAAAYGLDHLGEGRAHRHLGDAVALRRAGDRADERAR